MKKGFIAFIPVFVVAGLISVASVGLVASQRNKPLEAGSILSSSNSGSGKGSGSENSGKGSSSNSDVKSESKSEQKNEQGKSKLETKIEQKENKLKIETKSKTKTEGGIENESEAKIEIEDEGTPSATSSVTPGRKIRTNFPITVNPVTGEKTVTTPSGTHTVILPDVAIQNMIKAGFPVVLPPEPSPNPSPPEGTSSATPSATPSASPITGTDEGAVTLTEVNGQLVYEIPAVKPQKFLGIMKVDVKVKGIVSAESGSILKIKKSIFDSILDFLSF